MKYYNLTRTVSWKLPLGKTILWGKLPLNKGHSFCCQCFTERCPNQYFVANLCTGRMNRPSPWQKCRGWCISWIYPPPSNSHHQEYYMLQGLNSHYFHIIGDKLINPIIGFYIPIIRIPIFQVGCLVYPQQNATTKRPWHTFLEIPNLNLDLPRLQVWDWAPIHSYSFRMGLEPEKSYSREGSLPSMLHLTGSALLGILPGDKMFQAQRLTPSCTRPVVLHGYGGAGNEVEDSTRPGKSAEKKICCADWFQNSRQEEKSGVPARQWQREAEKIPQATQLGTWSCSNWASTSTTCANWACSTTCCSWLFVTVLPWRVNWPILREFITPWCPMGMVVDRIEILLSGVTDS